MENLVQFVEQQFVSKNELIQFNAGDTIIVSYKIREGNKERIQNFQGVVIQRRGQGTTETFTVRKISDGVGVERIFPVKSPFISEIKVVKRGKVRRARLFYLRDAIGKNARIKEKKVAR
ncbi:MAG: 50S ribosomal protein L19 [Bacteroidia bacterium]|nr:50S ribosomal protein L19 [Bacteroidia bacterium]